MTVKELKDWVNNLPEDVLDHVFVIRDLKTTEEEGKFAQKDEPVASAMVDTNQKRLCVFNIESQGVVQKIRASIPPKENNTSSDESK